MKPFFLPGGLLAASAYYCCLCCISNIGSFSAEAFLAPPSSTPAGHSLSQRGIARKSMPSLARWWHNSNAAAAKTATCSATRHDDHDQPPLSRILRTTPTLLSVHQLPNNHQRQRYSTTQLGALPEDAPGGSGTDSRSNQAPTNSGSASGTGTERAVNGVEGVPSEAMGDTAVPGAGREPGRGGAGKGLEGSLISRLSRRVADSFPLLTADEIKKEIRALLNPETKGEPKVRRAHT